MQYRIHGPQIKKSKRFIAHYYDTWGNLKRHCTLDVIYYLNVKFLEYENTFVM